MSLLATCNGKSKIDESVFENRMHHGMFCDEQFNHSDHYKKITYHGWLVPFTLMLVLVKELQKLGAGIELNGNSASVEGRRTPWW